MKKDDLISFESEIAQLFDDGYIPYMTHLSGGNEDQLLNLFMEIDKDDWVFSSHRNHYHYLLHTGKKDRLKGLIMRGKSMFVFDRCRNFFTSSILAATPAIAAGVALAIKRKGIDKHVWCFLGDGAEDEGHFFEAARYVDGHDLPCTFIVEDNDRSVVAGKSERWGKFSPVKFDCVRRYEYRATWPHGGTGHGMIDFKVKPDIGFNHYGNNAIITTANEEKYFDAVKESMEFLAENETVFIGYNVKHGSAYGSLVDVDDSLKIETPVAENLMTGLAMGMSLVGYRPLLFFERQDFIYNALDLMVNHIGKIKTISEGEFNFPVIIRAVKGGIYPFYAGITHTSDIASSIAGILPFQIYAPKNKKEIKSVYRRALEVEEPILICENKELY